MFLLTPRLRTGKRGSNRPRAGASRVAGLSALVVTLAAHAAPARACPVCNTGTGEQVRAGIFDGHFGQNLLLTFLPAPVFAALVAAIYFGPPRPRRQPPGRGRKEDES